MRSLGLMGFSTLALLIASCNVPRSEEIKDEHWARSTFTSAHAPAEKREAIIAILDAGLVKRWQSVQSVDRIFGTTFYAQRSQILPGRTVTSGVIFLEEQRGSGRDDVAGAITGWYFIVEFGSDGVITNYYLTNAGK